MSSMQKRSVKCDAYESKNHNSTTINYNIQNNYYIFNNIPDKFEDDEKEDDEKEEDDEAAKKIIETAINVFLSFFL